MADTPIVADQTDNFSDAARGVAGKVMLVNGFVPKAGGEAEFVRVQTAEYDRLRGQVAGSLGNCLGRAVDGGRLVNVAFFDSLDSYNAWRNSALFDEHLEIIRPYVESSSPAMFEVIYRTPDLG